MPIAKNEPTAALRTITVKFFDVDGSPKTSLTFSHAAGEVKTRYAGAAFVEAAADAVEVAYGDYEVTFSQAETNQNAEYLGVALIKSGYTTQTAYVELDTNVASIVAAIKAKTDNLPADPASAATVASEITAATSPLATSSALSTAQTAITAIKAKTDNLPSDPASAATVASEITAATSPLATSSALSTAQTAITAIKAKTDNLPADPASAATVAGQITAATSTIAADVWDKLVSGHTVTGSFGELLGIMSALAHVNAMIDFTYSGTGFLPTARLRKFVDKTALAAASPTHADDADSETHRFKMSAVDRGDGKPSEYRMKQDKP